MKALLYLIFCAIGFFVAWTMLGRGDTDGEASPAPDKRNISERSGAKVRSLSRSLNRYSTGEYQDAWEDLAKQGLSKRQRIEAQAHLLRAWANVDLREALAAAMEEPWHAGTYATTDDAGSLIKRSLGELFVSQPSDFVEIINDRSLGVLESVVLGRAFVESLGSHHPEILESLVLEIEDPKVREISQKLLEKQGQK